MSYAALPVVLLASIGMLGIPVLVGVYVHRDAAGRGMNATLWTLIALVAPALVGFIIYLIVRAEPADGKCPCCGAATAADWRCCPYCTAPLPPASALCAKKDRGLGAILTLVCLVPAVLLAVLALSYTSAGVGVGVTTLPADEYLQEMENPDIEKWLADCKAGEYAAHILQSGEELATGQQRCRYLVYIPGLRWDTEVDISQSASLFGTTVNLEFTGGSGSDDALTLITCTGENASPRLVFRLNGQRIACRYTQVDYLLGLTDAAKNKSQ